MRISALCCALLLLVSWAKADDDPTKKSFVATAVPDRIALTWKGDPATSQSVTWRTNVETTEGFAEIAVAGPGPDFVKVARKVEATNSELETNLGKARYHSVTFEDLEPNTLYAYRVGHAEAMSEWFQFRTTKSEAAAVQFVYLGDAQNNLKSLWSRLIRQAHSDAPKATFMLHAGDLVNRGDADHEWGEWFYSLGWISGSIPQIAVPGNHEYSRVDENSPRELTRHWRPQFELPENGPMGLEESVYYIDVQGVRLIGMDSNGEHEMQAAWLEAILAENPCRWTIVTHHHPIHSTSRGRDNEHLRRAWQPIYDKYGVDLVLQGHDHSYGRSAPRTLTPSQEETQQTAAKTEGATQPLADGGAAEGAAEGVQNVASGVRGRTPKGTVYVVSVSGPKMYHLKAYDDGEQNPFERRAANTQLYQVINIDGDELRFEARTATGSLYDAFTLRKQKEGPNEFISQIPENTSERLVMPEK